MSSPNLGPEHGAPGHVAQGHGVAADTETLPYRAIAIVGVVTLATFVAGVLWSTAILNRTVAEMNPKVETPKELEAPEVGIVNQRMFELDDRAEEKKAGQLRHLNSYGWVDAERKIAHIPIKRAMEQLVAEQKK